MPSKARRSFDKNLKDVNRLIDMYETAKELFESEEVGKMPSGYDVALRSGIVLLVTYWEAYVEDIASECVSNFQEHLSTPESLPQSLQKSVLKHLQKRGGTSYWSLSGDGWKQILGDLESELKGKRDFNFNTPKSEETQKFLSQAVGHENIIESWSFGGRSGEENAELLDKFIGIRGKIAHRGQLKKKVDPEVLGVALKLFGDLVKKTGGSLNKHMKATTGVGLWD